MTPILSIKNLSVHFKGNEKDFTAVNRVSFEINQGEILGIVGESGSGKTLSVLSILGLLPYPKAYHDQDSSIKFGAMELLNSPDLQKIRGNDISFIFQEPMSSLNPLHKIEKQISEAINIHQNLPTKKTKQKVIELLELTGIKNAKQRMKSYPHELSGGQRQRVMISMAIANTPKILIADEPTTALDVTIQAQILDLLLDLRKKLKMSIIFISHDLSVIRKIADRVAVMKDGKIIEQNSVKNIFENPQGGYTKALINSSNILNKNKENKKETLLSAQNIKVSYPLKKNFWGKTIQQLHAVDNVSLSLKKGETLGIVGESGSGKTTLGLSIANLIKHRGEISYKNAQNKEFRRFIQIVFQDPYNSLNPRMNIEQIIGEGLTVHFPKLSKQEKKEKIIHTLQIVGLSEDILEKYPHEFSGGQRQRIAIARALVLEPELLILDEPTSALDITIEHQILALLQNIQQKRELSYIFISHNMRAIRAIADRIAVMKDGKIVEIGTNQEIFEKPNHPYTKKLIESAICTS